MLIYEEIIEPYMKNKEQYLITEILSKITRENNIKEFMCKISLEPLNELDINNQLKFFNEQNGTYFYLGDQLSYSELFNILENDFKKLVIKVQPTEIVEINDTLTHTLTLKNNVKYMSIKDLVKGE